MLNNHSKNHQIASGGDSTIQQKLQKLQLSELKNHQIIIQKPPTLTATNTVSTPTSGKSKIDLNLLKVYLSWLLPIIAH